MAEPGSLGAPRPVHPEGALLSPRAAALVAAAGDRAAYRFLEFFTAQIRNPHTRRAYVRAVGEFCAWLEDKGLPSITAVSSVHIAAYVEELGRSLSAPTVKQRLAAIEEESARLAKMENDNDQSNNPHYQGQQGGQRERREDVDSRSVFVGNVDYGASPEEIQDHFKDVGSINRVTILLDKHTGHPKGSVIL